MLTARVSWDDGKFVAKVDSLSLEGSGESVREAQDELIQVMRTWIEANDVPENLAPALANAGFPGVDEDTELQLEFVESLGAYTSEY